MGQATNHDFIASKPSGRQPLYVWALVQKIPYPPTFQKRTPASPLKALYTGGHWGRSPAIVVSHNGPKNQNSWGSRGVTLGASFPVPTRLASGKCGSICEGRGRPRMISTAFDPAFLSLRKGVARRPDPFLRGVLEFVRAYKTLS